MFGNSEKLASIHPATLHKFNNSSASKTANAKQDLVTLIGRNLLNHLLIKTQILLQHVVNFARGLNIHRDPAFIFSFPVNFISKLNRFY